MSATNSTHSLTTAPIGNNSVPGTGDRIVSEREVASWLGVGATTLWRWRTRGHGPAFVRLSERRIGYRTSEIQRWLTSREQQPGTDPEVA